MGDPMMDVSLEAGGKRYALYFGNKARRLVERETGKSFAELRASSVHEMTAALWAALQRHHADLTIDDVDDIIDQVGQKPAWRAMGKAMALSGGMSEEEYERRAAELEAGAEGEVLAGTENGTGNRTSRRRSRRG